MSARLPTVDVDQSLVAAVRAEATQHLFHPRGTVRCIGTPLFRNQAARNLGCLLDVDRDVVSWICLPMLLGIGTTPHVPDFLVEKRSGLIAMDAVRGGENSPAPWIAEAAAANGYGYVSLCADEINNGFRLRNAIDLLRYCRWQCPLGDRIRLLAALDEHGSMTVSECLSAFLETRSIAGLSSLILHRFVEVDLDEALIGPETSVRRWRD